MGQTRPYPNMSFEWKKHIYTMEFFDYDGPNDDPDLLVRRAQTMAFYKGANAIIDGELRDIKNEKNALYQREFHGTAIYYDKPGH